MAALLAPSQSGTDHTSSTVVSDYFAHSGTGSTALTSPSLYPPSPGAGYKPHALGNINEVNDRPMNLAPPTQDADDSLDESLYADDPPSDPASASPPPDVRRGPSVKSRTSTYEQSLAGHSAVGLGLGLDRPKSRAASPFRLPPSPGAESLHVPRSPQHRPHSPGRSQSPMRLPPSPGRASRSPGHRSHSPAQRSYSPAPPSARSPSPLRFPQPSPGRSASPLVLSPTSHHSARSSGELPHSPCGTMPTLPYDQYEQYEPASTPPRQTRRVPVPASAPVPNLSPSPKLARGASSARRMIAKWENGPQELQHTPPRGKSLGAPATAPIRPLDAPTSPSPRRNMRQDYLDDKPLPIPTATAIPASANMPWPPPNSSRVPPGSIQMPAPLRGQQQQTPNKRAEHMSPSSWSPVQPGKRESRTDWAALSPGKSSHKSPKKRSPFKDIVNKFTGRKKDKEVEQPVSERAISGLHGDQSRRFISLDDDKGWFAQPQSGMDGNAVYSDRMGDEEMAPLHGFNSDAVRSSAVLFLSPTPGSTVTAWGSWLTAWATLTPKSLSITYAPTVPGGSPHDTAAYASIPRPVPETRPEVELYMRDCVEVRSLRPSEVRGRGIPPVPQGGGSEVLEIAFAHGLKRYVAVEGVTGRLGWVSAIWDVLLACKQEPGANMTLPPPSPSIAAYSANGPIILPRGLHDAPVQRYGDTWVAAGDLDGSPSVRGTPVRSLPPTPDMGAIPLMDPALSYDFQPGEIVPPGIRPGDTISTLRSGMPTPMPLPPADAFIEAPQDVHETQELPPLPPPKSRPRSALVSERIKAWSTDEPETPPARPLPIPVPRTEPPPRTDSVSGTGEGTEESRFSSTRSADKSLGTSSGATFTTATGTSVPLRKALVQMFDAATAEDSAPKRSRSAVMEERIRAWQPNEDTPPPLSRASTRRQAESLLSCDPSDLNPSRSASQIRPRVDSEVNGLNLGAVNAGLTRELPSVPEVAPSPREKSFGPRAPRAVSPTGTPVVARVPPNDKTEPAAVTSPLDAAEEKAVSSRALDAKPASSPALDAAVADAPLSPAITTPRMNARLLAAASVFEPSLADGSIPKRKPVSSFRTVTPEPTVASPLVTATPWSKPTPSSDTEALSEIQSVRSGLRSVKNAENEVSSGRGTAPLNFRRRDSPAVKKDSAVKTDSPIEADKLLIPAPLERAASSDTTDTTASVVDSPAVKAEDTPTPLPVPTTRAKTTTREPVLPRTTARGTPLEVPSPLQRATTSTSTTSDVTSIAPAAMLGETSSTVEAEESSMPPTRLGAAAEYLYPDEGQDRALPMAATGLDRDLPPLATDPEVLTRLDAHTSEHTNLSRQLDSVHTDVTAVAASLGGLGALLSSRNEDALPELAELTTRLDALDTSVRDIHGVSSDITPAFTQRFDAIDSDLRGIQMVLHETSAHVAALSTRPATVEPEPEKKEKELPPMPEETYTEVSEPRLPEIHAKLDALAHLIQELLQRQAELAESAALAAAAAAAGAAGGAAVERSIEEPSGQPEVQREAQAETEPPIPPATAAQLDAVAGMVSNLETERAHQTQQTADIARYLGDLNAWLEKFVQNSGGELESMSHRIEGLAGNTALVPEIHGMLGQMGQMGRMGGGDGVQAQRLDALVGMMAEERERQGAQINVVDHVVGLLDKQRQDNENLLRAVATDLTSEIRGERVKFIDAMQQATSMNMQIHVDEFKKALTNEVSLSMRELGELREQKKVLQHQIADLFSLMAKHGERDEHRSPAPPGMFPSPGPGPVPGPGPGPGPGPRSLPMPPK